MYSAEDGRVFGCGWLEDVQMPERAVQGQRVGQNFAQLIVRELCITAGDMVSCVKVRVECELPLAFIDDAADARVTREPGRDVFCRPFDANVALDFELMGELTRSVES